MSYVVSRVDVTMWYWDSAECQTDWHTVGDIATDERPATHTQRPSTPPCSSSLKPRLQPRSTHVNPTYFKPSLKQTLKCPLLSRQQLSFYYLHCVRKTFNKLLTLNSEIFSSINFTGVSVNPLLIRQQLTFYYWHRVPKKCGHRTFNIKFRNSFINRFYWNQC